jgi:hypothetical protein
VSASDNFKQSSSLADPWQEGTCGVEYEQNLRTHCKMIDGMRIAVGRYLDLKMDTVRSELSGDVLSDVR